MGRVVVTAALIFQLAAGPLCCCCTLARLEAKPKADARSSSGPAWAGSCCRCGQDARRPGSDSSTPSPHKPCPCHRGNAEALATAPTTTSAELFAQEFCRACSAAYLIGPTA